MRALRLFGENEAANTGVVFALALLPLMLAVGAAVDYARAASARTTLQKAVDAAVIAVARDAASLSDGALQIRGHDFFAANFSRADTTLAPLVVERGKQTVRVAASGAVPAAFLNIIGIKAIPIASEAVAGWGHRTIEMALVLDNTGSMTEPLGSGRKIDELKKAAKRLIDQAETSSPQAGAIKISIVPFDTQVNAGNLLSPLDLDFEFGVSRLSWQGCVMDRSEAGNYDVNDEPPRLAVKGSLFPAVACGTGNLARLQPLTASFSDLRNAVASMRPSGCTNITIGASWGLKTLSSGSPLTEGAAYGSANVDKYMVILTDGENTKNRAVTAPDCGGRGNAAMIDARTRAACDVAKAAGVKVYTVLVGTGNATLLGRCAGNGGTFQEVKDAAAITSAFSAILNDVLTIRLTQ